ncbi:hypothetical protein B0H13DRAFT_2115651 [Mycena leptocephala]|nr:hypothetical protein B0H13DRAFT_2115651 [Mycena leptocephala]
MITPSPTWPPLPRCAPRPSSARLRLPRIAVDADAQPLCAAHNAADVVHLHQCYILQSTRVSRASTTYRLSISRRTPPRYQAHRRARAQQLQRLLLIPVAPSSPSFAPQPILWIPPTYGIHSPSFALHSPPPRAARASLPYCTLCSKPARPFPV